PLTGGNGVLFAVAAIAATAWIAWRARTDGARRFAIVFAVGAAALVAAYFIGYQRPPQHEGLATRTFVDGVVVFAHLVIAPFGPYAARAVVVAAPAALLLLVAAGALLWRAQRTNEALRPLVVGVAATAAGTLLVFGGIALGRGARGWPPGLETHYASLGLPLWIVTSVGLLAVGARKLAAAIGLSATVAFVLALPLGPRPEHVALGDAFQRDWCAGVPAATLAERHMRLLYYVDTPAARAAVAAHLVALRAHPPRRWRCDR
ncbi:MAG TPA: hypothetical protein VF997_18865, partial [Polyangia bacterium]